MLILEAETAINQLPVFKQEHMRYQVANNIKHLYKHYKQQ
jgi:hypothetical protein